MKRLNILIACSILAALVLALVAVIPALAGSPLVQRFVWEEEGDDMGCGFPIPYLLEGKITQITQFDEQGNPVSDIYHWGGSKYKMTYNGHQLVLRSSQTMRFTTLSSEQTLFEYTGATWIGNLPGYGVVNGTVGRQVLLETCDQDTGECEIEVLHWSGMVFDDPETICTYMATGE